MAEESEKVVGISEALLLWAQSEPQQVVLLAVTYVIGFVLVKKDRLS